MGVPGTLDRRTADAAGLSTLSSLFISVVVAEENRMEVRARLRAMAVGATRWARRRLSIHPTKCLGNSRATK
jgi:hypothetical protein